MKRIEPAAWTDEDSALWARITAHDFELTNASLTFAGRLARDHDWSVVRVRAAIDEYRRFCFLAVRARREVTPSEEVDEVWHQHLAYSRDYWEVWCRGVLRHDLHHGPTLGGSAEGKRFAGQYAETLAAYEAWFGPPPAALWPGTAELFGRPRFHVVDRTTHIAVPVPRGMSARLRRLAQALGFGALLALVSIRPAEAASLDPLDWTAGPFLTLYVALACASLAAGWTLPPRIVADRARPGGRSRFTASELGYLAGGATRASDVLVLEDIAAGRIEAVVKVRSLGPFSSETDILKIGGQDAKRKWLVAEETDEVADLRRGLVEEGLIPSDADRQAIRRIVLALVGPVVLLGLAKLVVGVERDKPVGALVFLLVVTAFAALVLVERRSRGSRAGRALLDVYRAEHARALRAPRSEEAIAAFAVMGAAALAGTPFESYGRLLKSEQAGGCGGSGCGGGGCGGCGGD